MTLIKLISTGVIATVYIFFKYVWYYITL